VIPLIVLTVFPQNSHFQYGNSSSFVAEDAAGAKPDLYFAGGGDVFLGLRDYYDNDLPHPTVGGASDDVYLFVLAGDVMVVLPDDEYSSVNADVLWGKVLTSDDGNADNLGRSGYVDFNVPRGEFEKQLSVHIYVLSGTVTIIDPEGK
jgi:hypothetical protein